MTERKIDNFQYHFCLLSHNFHANFHVNLATNEHELRLQSERHSAEFEYQGILWTLTGHKRLNLKTFEAFHTSLFLTQTENCQNKKCV